MLACYAPLCYLDVRWGRGGAINHTHIQHIQRSQASIPFTLPSRHTKTQSMCVFARDDVNRVSVAPHLNPLPPSSLPFSLMFPAFQSVLCVGYMGCWCCPLSAVYISLPVPVQDDDDDDDDAAHVDDEETASTLLLLMFYCISALGGTHTEL